MPNLPVLSKTTWTLVGTLGATVVLGIGLGYWYIAGPGATPPPTPPALVTERGSLLSYMKGDGTWECTVKSENATVSSTGVVYVGQGKMRGDFSSILKMGEPRTSKSHMIMHESTQYVWNDDMPTMGVRTTVTLATIPKQASPDAPFDIHHASDVTCVPWRLDDRVFVLPDHVQFHSVEDMVKQGGLPQPPTSPSSTPVPPMPDRESQCRACDEAGPYKEACLAALSCGNTPQ